MTNTASNSSASNSIHRNVVPSEVGWQFLSQYYTYVNKEPDRLYCFYNKKSTFLHGTEGEDEKPCHGQQEIHAKISSLGFQDCKVFIHSVDAQASADGGIVIQLIGEMANHGEEWRKFVQTVFLAEQPNGYFVLNDIFRFLKEEIIESDEAEGEPEAVPAPVAEAAPTEPIAVPAVPAPGPEQLHEPSPSPGPPTTFIVAPVSVPEPVPIEEPTTVAELPEPEPYVAPEPPSESQPPSRPNGVAHHTQDAAEKQAPAAAPATAAAPQSTPSAATPVEKSRSPAPPAAISTAPTPPPVAPVAAAPPQPHAPRQPKTWANLAAANSKKWGSAVAQESRGTTEVVPPSPSANTTSHSGTSTPVTGGPPQQGGRSAHPALVQAQTITTAQCFIKGVTDNISEQALRSVLTTRFGPLKELEIVRSKVCAFGEFTTIESARKAIIASLHIAQGGEGGVFIDLPDGERARVVVDTKKERSERPAPRPRGGAPQGAGTGDGNANSGGRGGGVQGNAGGGGFRGGRGRGRGGPPGK